MTKKSRILKSRQPRENILKELLAAGEKMANAIRTYGFARTSLDMQEGEAMWVSVTDRISGIDRRGSHERS